MCLRKECYVVEHQIATIYIEDPGPIFKWFVDHALVIRNEKFDQQAVIQMCKFIVL